MLDASCDSVTFSTNGISYSQVCGRVIGYQYASPDALRPDGGYEDLDSPYVDGLSITYGSPRKHIWTLIASWRVMFHDVYTDINCPCNSDSTITVQSFIGDNYFCESGNSMTGFTRKLYTSDPLWDGEGCGGIEGPCCNAPGIPWFHKVLDSSTTDDIELRACGDQYTFDEDVPVSLYEI